MTNDNRSSQSNPGELKIIIIVVVVLIIFWLIGKGVLTIVSFIK